MVRLYYSYILTVGRSLITAITIGPLTGALAAANNKFSFHLSSGGAGKDSNGSSSMTVRPFFEVDVELSAPDVVLHPSLDEIQECINRSAQAILKCFKTVKDWNLESIVTENMNLGSMFSSSN